MLPPPQGLYWNQALTGLQLMPNKVSLAEHCSSWIWFGTGGTGQIWFGRQGEVRLRSLTGTARYGMVWCGTVLYVTVRYSAPAPSCPAFQWRPPLLPSSWSAAADCKLSTPRSLHSKLSTQLKCMETDWFLEQFRAHPAGYTELSGALTCSV